LPAQVKRAIDQTDVTVRLWEVSQHTPSQRIELFGEQANVVTVREQTLEQLSRFCIAALQDVIVDEPEAAR
jgi:hypothetical protein